MKAFSPSEQEYLKEQLIVHGREIFARHGIRKTTIQQLCSAAGIAAGSFYAFYSDKSDLFFDIVSRDEEGFAAPATQDTPVDFSPYPAIRAFLAQAVEKLHTDPVLRLLLDRDEMGYLQRLAAGSPEGERKDWISLMRSRLLSVIESWKQKGWLIEVESVVLADAIRSLFFVSLHKIEIGQENYDRALTLLIDLIAKGISKGVQL
jgi:TetR/AcrR family transcriptional regulator